MKPVSGGPILDQCLDSRPALQCKVGDVVHVKAEIIAVDGNCVRVELPNGMDGGWTKRAAVVHVEPRPIAVGDTVKWGAPGVQISGVVKAIDDDLAWVEVLHGGRTTVALSELTRSEAA